MRSYFQKMVAGFLLILAATSLEAVFWSPSMEVSPAATISTTSPLALATNDNGDAIAAWSDGTNIYTSMLPFASGATWSTPIIVSPIGAGNTLEQIVIALDVNGNASIGWVYSDASSVAYVDLSYMNAGTNFWTTPFTGSLVNISASTISMGIDNNGIPFAFWSYGDNGSTSAVSLYYYMGGTWITDPNFPGTNGSFPPDGGGNIYASYMAGNGDNGDLIAFWVADFSNNFYYVSTRIGGTWSTPITLKIVTNRGPNESFPVLAIAVNNTDQAAFVYQNGSLNIVEGVTFPITTLPPPSSTPLSGTINYESAATAINSQGNIAAAWQDYQADVGASYYDTSTTTWTSVASIGITPLLATGFYPNPVVSIDSANNAPAVWVDRSNTIQSSILIEGGAWSAQEQLSADGAVTTYPLVSSSLQGRSIAIWGESGTPGNVRYVLHDLFAPVAPAVTNLGGSTGKNQFLLQAKYFQTLTWTASETPDVVSYQIYLGTDLSNLIGTVSASGPLRFVVQNVNPSQSTTYAVVAVSSTGFLSAPTFITLSP